MKQVSSHNVFKVRQYMSLLLFVCVYEDVDAYVCVCVCECVDVHDLNFLHLFVSDNLSDKEFVHECAIIFCPLTFILIKISSHDLDFDIDR